MMMMTSPIDDLTVQELGKGKKQPLGMPFQYPNHKEAL